MKKSHLFILCGAIVSVMAIQSCNPEEDVKDNKFGGTEMTFNATIEPGSLTKTILDETTGKVNWLPGDNLSVFFDSRQVKFESTTETESETTFFVGTSPVLVGINEDATAEPGFVKALYPYNKDAVAANGNVITMLPAYQKAVEGTFDNNTFISMAQASAKDYNLTFYNVLGGLRFKVEQDGVRKVTLKGNNGETLAGKIEIGFDASGHPAVSSVKEPLSEVTLECPNGFKTDTWYYISTIPAVLTKGYTLSVDIDGIPVDKVSDAACEIKRSIFASVEIKADELNQDDGFVVFDDEAFKNYCISNYDTDRDGKISKEEALCVTDIQLCTDELNIKSVEGLSAFKNLKFLSLYGTWESYLPEGSTEVKFKIHGTLKRVNVAGLSKLSYLELPYNNIEEVIFGGNDCLKEIHLAYNSLKSIDVTSLTALEYLYLDYNALTSIDVTTNTALKELGVERNAIQKLDITANAQIEKIGAWNNKLTSLQLKDNPSLNEIKAYNNHIKEISLAECPNIKIADLSNNEFEEVDVKNLPSLSEIYLSENKIAKIDFTGDDNITRLAVSDNLLTEIDITKLKKLSNFQINNNKLSAINVSYNEKLTSLWCSNNKITSLDIKNNSLLSNLYCEGNLITRLDVSNNGSLNVLDCSPMNDESGRNVLSQLIIFKGQSIRKVTSDRDNSKIPDGTSIIEVTRSSSSATVTPSSSSLSEDNDSSSRKTTLGERRRKMIHGTL